jgi:NitT/TauT family transport system substrate-binding protein
MKKLMIILTLLLLVLLTGCTQDVVENPEEMPEPIAVSVAGLKGPTSMGMIQLIDGTLPNLKGYDSSYMSYGAPDELIGKILTKEVQIAAVPTNMASLLYNKTEGAVQLLAVNTLGVIHVVGKNDVSTLEDLKGKTLYVSGKGATPDFALNYMIESMGLSEEIDVQFYADHASLSQAVIAGTVDYAVLPEPFVTQVVQKSESVDFLIDLNTVWAEATQGESELAMGCLVIDRTFADENPEYVEAFLKDYSASVAWVNENPVEAGVLIEKHAILPSADLAAAAIPSCAIVYKSATDAKNGIDAFLEILYGYNPASVGGELPDESFYYGYNSK